VFVQGFWGLNLYSMATVPIWTCTKPTLRSWNVSFGAKYKGKYVFTFTL
jgi:hypothetical protein